MDNNPLYKDYPCVVTPMFCPNKQDNRWICHGNTKRPECYVNWGSADPENLEPYEEYVDILIETGNFHG